MPFFDVVDVPVDEGVSELVGVRVFVPVGKAAVDHAELGTMPVCEPMDVTVIAEDGEGVAVGLASIVMVGVGDGVPESNCKGVAVDVGVPVVERLRVRVALGVPEGCAPRKGEVEGVRDEVKEGMVDTEVVGIVAALTGPASASSTHSVANRAEPPPYAAIRDGCVYGEKERGG
jgi:hypothetical protein